MPTSHRASSPHSTQSSSTQHVPSPPRSSTPSTRAPSPRDPDWIDVLSPREPGLPLHFARSNSGMSGSSVQVIDSSAARRRGGGGPAVEGVSSTGEEGGDAYDGGKEKEGKEWRGVGIGMEVENKESKESKGEGKEGKGKWDKLIPVRSGPMTWTEMGKAVGMEVLPHVPLIIYTGLSLFTRLYRIGLADSVVWDEAHFGKFGGFYLNRSFFFDVHPPLGKMLVGLAGAVSGFNGSFDFPSGAVYPAHVPFRTMRILLALPGVALVPLAWGTSIELKFTKWSTHIVTLMVLCDLAWLVISRFILLDSMLLFFTFTTVYFMACFNNQQRKPFSDDWWIFLLLTGISIGCVASVKWVGLFVTTLVGLYTAEDLWNKLGDLKMPFRTYVRHVIARVLCLIVVPFCVYALCFKMHFIILNRSGSGDSQMSSLFQAHLEGNDFARNPLEPAYGSKVTLKNMGYGGGLLHSHVATYPVGSQQQQVTCYHYKDENNEFIVTPTWEMPHYDASAPLVHLTHGAVMRLVHNSTGRNLHSHAVAAPVTSLNNEVSGYGNDTIGDSNDYWIVEVVDDLLRGGRHKVDRIHSLSTRLRFRHQNSGCYLIASNAVLPQWGFKQVEVSCDKNNNPKDEHTYWNIESHWNDRLPAGDQKLYKSPFFRDFWHLNVAMMTSNNALVPDADKEDSIASGPFDWPFLYESMRMNGWGAENIKFYLTGNIIVWWGSSLSLILFIGTLFWHLARFQRKINDFAPGEWNQFLYVSKIAFGGWLLHYLPFLIMGRVTYLHHYLPTLWFAVIMFGNLLDHFIFKSRSLTHRTKSIIFALLAGSIVGVAIYFRHTAWGIEGPASAMAGRQWRKSWNIMD